MRKFFSSFIALNITQFLTALNDNLYKLLLIFFVISMKGETNSNTILAIAGAVFVIPFLLFASTAGTLADRYSKRTIIYITRIGEILATGMGVIAFTLNSPLLGYIVLFLMATQSAIFSPCKFGIIPEIVPKNRISHFNGIITSTTYLAIIIGTFLGSFLTDITQKNFILASSFCFAIAIVGAIASLGLEPTKAQASTKQVSPRFISMILRTLKRAKRQRYLLTTIIFGAFFLLMGAYVQLNIIPFSLQSLGLTEVFGGYLFLLTAVGIGIGSFLAGKLSGKQVELGFVPLAAIGVGLCLAGLWLFQHTLFGVVPILVLTGFFGGFFVVPIDSFIQVASLDRDRGQNVAASNFLSFVGVIIASGLIALLGALLGLSAAIGFLIVGAMTCVMGMTLFFLYADQILRLLVAASARLFCQLTVKGLDQIHPNSPSLVIAPRTSWLDTVVVMATLPRLVRYIVPLDHKKKHKKGWLYKLVSLIPLDTETFASIGKETLDIISKELKTGHSVCLMHPVDLPSASLKEWEHQLEGLIIDIHVPVLPVHIHRKPAPANTRWGKQLLSLTRTPLTVSYGRHSE